MKRSPAIVRMVTAVVSAILLASFGNTGDKSDIASQDQFLAKRDLFRAASECLDSGDIGRTLLLLDSIHTMDSTDPDAYYLMGKALLFQGDSIGAVEILEQAVQTSPRSTRIKLLLARIHLNSGKCEEPLALTEQTFLTKPADGEALYLNGWALLLRGDTAAALDQFEQILESELMGGDK